MGYKFITGLSGDFLGATVASAGDVDGDGQPDILIGAYGAGEGPGGREGDSPGVVYLVGGDSLAGADAADGTTDGVIDLANLEGLATSYRFEGEIAGDFAGWSASSAGDVDGDGLSDLVIGAYLADGGIVETGQAYLATAQSLAAADLADGTLDGVIGLQFLAGLPGSYQFNGVGRNDGAGYSVASAGDVDGDGRGDLMIGAAFADGGGGNSGEVYLATSSDLAAADAADGTTDGVIDLDNLAGQGTSYQFIGVDPLDTAGTTVAVAGDVDGDGLDDLLISAPRGAETYLVAASDLAAADAEDGLVDGVINLGNVAGQTTSYQFGGAFVVSVASAGDTDGDGLADLILGAPTANGGGRGSGEAFLATAADLATADAADGSIDGVIDLGNLAGQGNAYRFVGVGVYDEAGTAVASAGDVDGDGLDDLLIGAPNAGTFPRTGEGEVYLAVAADLAAADGADGMVDGVIDLENLAGLSGSYRFQGEIVRDDAGDAVAGAGDVDGDGLDDLLIGAPGVAAAFLIHAKDLAAADAADGTVDGVIKLDSVAFAPILVPTEANDTLSGTPESDTVDLLAGDDWYDGRTGDDVIRGGAGNDILYGDTGDDQIFGGADNDIIDGGAGDDLLDGGDGIDTASYTQALSFVNAKLTTGKAIGADGTDVLVAFENLVGSQFGDILTGDVGLNTLTGGSGDDLIRTKGGNDVVDAGDGDDIVWGDTGAEVIDAGDGADIVKSGSGADTVRGGAGEDVLRAGSDDDFVWGDGNNDRLFGNRGADNLRGGNGDDALYGGSGADTLIGGNGDDALRGEAGQDDINGGAGDDNLYGGASRDVFVFADDGASGADRIKDWEDGLDRLDVTDFDFVDFAAIQAIASNAGSRNMKLDFGAGNQVVIEDFRLADFDVTDVSF